MKIIKGIFRVVIILLLLACVGVEAYLHGAFDFFEHLDTVESVAELAEYTGSQLREGKDTYDVYAKNLSESQVKSVNRHMDGFFGSVETYTVIGKKMDGTLKLRMNLNVSDNLNVWNALISGDGSELLQDKSLTLYQEADRILKTEIRSDMTDFEKEKAIHDYIILNCAFAEGYSARERKETDEVYTAYGALVNKTAVCNGYAEAMYLLLNAAGVECDMVVGTADGSDHAWNIVKLDKEWYQVDATWDDPTPDQKGYVQYSYYNLTDEQMAESHQWNQDDYPKCTSEKYNYFVYYKQVCRDYKQFVNKVERQIMRNRDKITVLVKDYDKEKYDLSFIMDKHQNVLKANYTVLEMGYGAVLTINITYV